MGDMYYWDEAWRMEEFNLSKKIKYCGYQCDCGFYDEEDVKEFIERLKLLLCIKPGSRGDLIIEWIDVLAGERFR